MTDHRGGVTKYTYDQNGNVTSITNPFGETTKISYDALGRETEKLTANAMLLRREYDAAGRETSRKYEISSKTLASYIAIYDAAGNRVQVTESDGSVVKYGYDANHQLTEEIRRGVNAFTAAYTYDHAGNRLTKTLNGAATLYEYDHSNALVRSISPTGRSTSFTHDACGNLVSTSGNGSDVRYEWDVENRLFRVINAGESEQYSYAYNGARESKILQGKAVHFIWDGFNVLAETDASGETLAQYTDLPGKWGGLTSLRQRDESYHFAFDLSSNITRLVNDAGTVSQMFAYDAFGCPLGKLPDDSTAYRFGGQVGYYCDAVDRVYVRMRHYSSEDGRWISRDPIGFRGRDWNLHRYVGNAPTGHVDPTGYVDCGGAKPCSAIIPSKVNKCLKDLANCLAGAGTDPTQVANCAKKAAKSVPSWVASYAACMFAANNTGSSPWIAGCDVCTAPDQTNFCGDCCDEKAMTNYYTCVDGGSTISICASKEQAEYDTCNANCSSA